MVQTLVMVLPLSCNWRGKYISGRKLSNSLLVDLIYYISDVKYFTENSIIVVCVIIRILYIHYYLRTRGIFAFS